MNQYSILVLLGTAVAGTAVAQSTTTTYQRDLNGRQVAILTSSVTADGEQSRQLEQSINGRTIPREQVTEKVIRKDATSKVTERTVRRLDPNGVLAGTERVVIEETAGPQGTKTVKETIYRSTLNGPLREEERSTAETSFQGNVLRTNVVVERPNLNRGFSPVERREMVSTGTPQNQQTTETLLVPDQAGRFTVTKRKETTVTVQGGETKSNSALYEIHETLEPTLTSQEVSTTTRKPDGAEVVEINLYTGSFAGKALSAGARSELQEQKIVERRVGSDGSVTETTSVRLPISFDAGRLDAPRVISETVCKGKCVPDKPAEPKPAPKQ